MKAIAALVTVAMTDRRMRTQYRAGAAIRPGAAAGSSVCPGVRGLRRRAGHTRQRVHHTRRAARYRTISTPRTLPTPACPARRLRPYQAHPIQPSSAAAIDTFPDGPPVWTTSADRARSKAAGSPSSLRTQRRPGISTATRQFSFIPQGSTLTYRQARLLPGSPQAFRAQFSAT